MSFRQDLARFAARAGSSAVRNASSRVVQGSGTRGMCAVSWREFGWGNSFREDSSVGFRGSKSPTTRRPFSTQPTPDSQFASAEKAIITAFGPDRPGLVSSLAKTVLDCGANVENTRMARLGDDCNIMMLVNFADSSREDRIKFSQLAEEIPGLTVKVRPTSKRGSLTEKDQVSDTSRWRKVFLHGADFKGSLHAVTGYLGEEGINIETLNTDSHRAPFGDSELFTMEAVIEMGPDVSLNKFKKTMDKLKRRLGVDIIISEHESHRDD